MFHSKIKGLYSVHLAPDPLFDQEMKPISALDLWNKEKNELRLKTGSRGLDEALGGGLAKGLIEISGVSGSGKTELAMHFLLQVCKL